MKRKKDMFKAFMAYKYFMKDKEEAEERARQERIEAAREEREYQLEQMEDALVNAISSMNCTYDRLAEESGFYEQVGIGDQMLKDLWTYSLCECASSGLLDDLEIESFVERILDRAIAFNEVSVSEHLDNMNYNSEYEEYINNCFVGDSYYPGMFWILLATMSGNEGERVKESIGFTKSYRETLLLLDSYLSYAYPGSGFLDKGDELSMEMINKTSAFIQANDDLSVGEYQTQHILNPLVVTIDDIEVETNDEIMEDDSDSKLTYEECFEALNVLQFEQVKFDNFTSDDRLEVIYNVVNRGNQRITYFEASFAFFDNDECLNCTDDRFHDCALEVGKKCYMGTYPIMRVGDVSEIVSVQLYRYEYRTDEYIAKIDLQTKEYAFEMLDGIDEDVFHDLNVLNIEYLRKKDTSWGDEVYLYKVTNTGNIPIKSVLVDFVYYNEQGDTIYTDCRSEDILLDVNRSLKMESYVSVDNINEKAAYGEPYSYKYELLKENKYGVQEVYVNLQTKLCRG